MGEDRASGLSGVRHQITIGYKVSDTLITVTIEDLGSHDHSACN